MALQCLHVEVNEKNVNIFQIDVDQNDWLVLSRINVTVVYTSYSRNNQERDEEREEKKEG